MTQFNFGKMPSLNQIEWGLISEAMKEVELAMGSMVIQINLFAAQANIKKTWEDMIATAKVTNRDAPLLIRDRDNAHKNTLRDPTYSVTALILYIYGAESAVYKSLNHASRHKDTTKVATLGPYASALYPIIWGTQGERTDDFAKKYNTCDLYRGGGQTEEETNKYVLAKGKKIQLFGYRVLLNHHIYIINACFNGYSASYTLIFAYSMHV